MSESRIAIGNSNKWWGAADPESLREVEAWLTRLREFCEAIEKEWIKERPNLYKVIPRELVLLLDSVTDFCSCSIDGCLEPCHPDWDFCLEHGKRVCLAHECTKPTVEGYDYCLIHVLPSFINPPQ